MATNPTEEFPQFLRLTYDTEDNNWGNICNSNFELISRAIAGYIEINCAGASDVVLSETDYSHATIVLVGVISNSINVIVPSEPRSFLLRNSCTGFDGSGADLTVTVKTAGGTGRPFKCNHNSRLPLYSDGINVFSGIYAFDAENVGIFTGFQSTGINDEATANVLTLTAANRFLLAPNTIITLSGGTIEFVRTSGNDIDHLWFDEESNTFWMIAGGSSKTIDPNKTANLNVHNLTLMNDGILTVAGAVVFSSTLEVNGNVTFAGLLTLNGDEVINGALTVTGPINGAILQSAAHHPAEDFALAGHDHPEATPSAAGFISAADKAKLDALPELMLHCRDEKDIGLDGGTFLNTVGGFGRLVDDVLANEMSTLGASVTGDTITLPAGTYWIDATAPAFKVGRHKAKLYNNTDGVALIVGTSEYSGPSAGDASSFQTSSRISGRFSLSATKDLKIIHSCEDSRATDGRGVASSLGTMVEVYTDVVIRRLPS